jgi:hypothetical protein
MEHHVDPVERFAHRRAIPDVTDRQSGRGRHPVRPPEAMGLGLQVVEDSDHPAFAQQQIGQVEPIRPARTVMSAPTSRGVRDPLSTTTTSSSWKLRRSKRFARQMSIKGERHRAGAMGLAKYLIAGSCQCGNWHSSCRITA